MLLDPRRYLSTLWQGTDLRGAGQDLSERVALLAKDVGACIRGLKLGDLADLDIRTPPANGQVPTYNATLRKWLPGTPSGGAGLSGGFRAYRSSNYVLGAPGFFSVVYDTQEYDELGEYDTATGWYRPKVTGMYLVVASLQTSATMGAGQRLHMDLMKDNGGAGVLVSSMGDTPGANDANADRHIQAVIVPLVANSDYYVNNYSSAAATFQGGTEYLWFAGKRLI